MDDSLSVAGRERVRHLDADVENLLQLDRLAAQPLLQAHAFQLLHDDERTTFVVLDVMNDADAGMIQLRGGAGLAHEAVERFAVIGQIVRDELQGDVAAEPRVLRLVNHAHAAAAKLPHNAVVGNCLADHANGRGFHLAVMLGRSEKAGQPALGVSHIGHWRARVVVAAGPT